jgi:flagellar hook-basal body complex protein FliE
MTQRSTELKFNEIKGYASSILAMAGPLIQVAVPGSEFGKTLSSAIETVNRYLNSGDKTFESLEDLSDGLKEIRDEVAEMMKSGTGVPQEKWGGVRQKIDNALDRIKAAGF